MGGVRDPADVAAIGDREQREQPDHGVLGGVDPAHEVQLLGRAAARGARRGISIQRPIVS